MLKRISTGVSITNAGGIYRLCRWKIPGKLNIQRCEPLAAGESRGIWPEG
jgi:hypothetical protein